MTKQSRFRENKKEQDEETPELSPVDSASEDDSLSVVDSDVPYYDDGSDEDDGESSSEEEFEDQGSSDEDEELIERQNREDDGVDHIEKLENIEMAYEKSPRNLDLPTRGQWTMLPHIRTHTRPSPVPSPLSPMPTSS